MVWERYFGMAWGPLVVLRENVIGKHYRSILVDHLHPMPQTQVRRKRTLFQDYNELTHLAVFKHG